MSYGKKYRWIFVDLPSTVEPGSKQQYWIFDFSSQTFLGRPGLYVRTTLDFPGIKTRFPDAEAAEGGEEIRARLWEIRCIIQKIRQKREPGNLGPT